MAEVFSVRLTRPESSVSWGFRLQGGSDFATPLSVQLVQPNSIAEQFGLCAGDGVLQINGLATETMEHEAAKMEIIRSGNSMEFLIQRGAVTTWRPKVTPMSELRPAELQTHTLPGEAPPVQKTSLAANKQPVQQIGSAHNRAAKPFGAGGTTVETPQHISVRDSFPDAAPHYEHRNQLQEEYAKECGGFIPNETYASPGPVQTGPKAASVVHAQYNTPIGIYSNNNVKDTFSQQADILRNELGNVTLHDDRVDNPNVYVNNNVTKGPTVGSLSVQTSFPPALSVRMPTSSGVSPSARLSPAPVSPKASLSPKAPLSPRPPLSPGYKSAVMEALEQEGASPLKATNIQSKSFRLLEQELESGDVRDSVVTASTGSNCILPPGVRSVQAPATKVDHLVPAGPRYKQPTGKCYVCDGLITGVFVRVKEHCLHSDCLRCAQCKRPLKNIGYIWVQDQIYCVQHARELTRPPGGGYTAYVIDAPEGTN